MFKHIMAPVDLAHLDRLGRALNVTVEEARHWKAPVTFVSISAAAPSALAHNPHEFAKKLEDFAEGIAKEHGIETRTHPIIGHDPVTDVDDMLLKAVHDLGADLVVMGSHKPGAAEYIWPSNGGKLASHAAASVMLVRGE